MRVLCWAVVSSPILCLPNLNIAIHLWIHYQLSCVSFDELKGLKCIFATQESIKECSSSEKVWIGRIVFDEVLEEEMVNSE